jgi:hypothetical protein
MIYALTEIYYMLRGRALFESIKKFVFLCGQHTLVLYITHQGFRILLEPLGIGLPALTVISIAGGIALGTFLDGAFAILEKKLLVTKRPDRIKAGNFTAGRPQTE